MSAASVQLHASCVAVGKAGVLLTGAAGAGKSTLALELIALGARLVADDQVLVAREGAQLIASAPDATAGMIEARGVGLLKLACLATAPLAVLVDLDTVEARRLPPGRQAEIAGVRLPLIHGRGMSGLPAILTAWLAEGGALLDSEA